jgi:hypothetical protein
MTPNILLQVSNSYFDGGPVTDRLANFYGQILVFLPKLIIAAIIWFLGSYLIEIGSKFFRKYIVSKFKTSKPHLNLITTIVSVFIKIFLVLFILDFLNIGKTFVDALVSSLTNALAIMIGLSFGLALQDDAKKILKDIKTYFNK